MLKKEEISNNVNTEYMFSKDYLKESRYELCRFIAKVCGDIDDITHETASSAMVYVNYFFVKKCLINYDKLVIACAAILLACKYNNIQGKFDQICRRYLEYNNRILGQCTTVIKAEDIQKIKEKICNHELILLKSLNFNINIDLPNEFIYVYSVILYPENEDDVIQFALKVSADSFFTFAPLLYKNYVIAVACIVIASNYLSLPSILDKNFKGLINMKRFSNPSATEEEFNRSLLNYENKSFHLSNDLRYDINTENKSNSYFDILEVHKKIHPLMEKEELIDCIKILMEYYEDTKPGES